MPPGTALLDAMHRARLGYDVVCEDDEARAAALAWQQRFGPHSDAWRDCLEHAAGSLHDWLVSLAPAEAWAGPTALEAELAARPFPRLMRVGYWRDGPDSPLPHPNELTAPLVARALRPAWGAQLRGGAPVTSQLGL